MELSLINYEKAYNFLMSKLGLRQHEIPIESMDGTNGSKFST